MKQPCLAAFALVLIATPGFVLGQGGAPPSDDCTTAVVQIAPLPFYWGSSSPQSNVVDLSNLGSCAAGLGGTSTNGQDFVYELVLGPVNDVTCSLSVSEWHDEMAFVLSTSCAAPLDASACLFGEIVPPGGTGVSFNTSTLGLGAGTYYVWGDRASGDDFSWWELTCTGNLVPVELRRIEIE